MLYIWVHTGENGLMLAEKVTRELAKKRYKKWYMKLSKVCNYAYDFDKAAKSSAVLYSPGQVPEFLLEQIIIIEN
jgi:hypothetical protein